MPTLQENLLNCLRDAHAMECHAEKMLKALADQLSDCTEIKARLDEHLLETMDQQVLLETGMKRYADCAPTQVVLKDPPMIFAHAVERMSLGHEALKRAMTGYVLETIEIALYTVLNNAAQAAGDTELQAASERILLEEVAMAQWFKEHLQEITQAFIKTATPPDA
ncbi:DUF892 family protein [Pseudomonas sp. dw_358]|uniref:DUF892 family protein n=1 Tax=Pseudomonas sp. dw_358 TaxID=2720083 RepID=UPI001BD39E1A|nr:DUF892 family protein [Pseudomonas sp. dw_358]